MTPTPAGSLARRVLWHPFPWAVVCFAGAVVLFGLAQEFWGFLFSLVRRARAGEVTRERSPG